MRHVILSAARHIPRRLRLAARVLTSRDIYQPMSTLTADSFTPAVTRAVLDGLGSDIAALYTSIRALEATKTISSSEPMSADVFTPAVTRAGIDALTHRSLLCRIRGLVPPLMPRASTGRARGTPVKSTAVAVAATGGSPNYRKLGLCNI
ncbi:hypothetical protein DFH07DRAFT_424922 [Mycena maculata]|uniref:Uncharacterized protein n=1 Tax=Mycena maculata TaxID=230809 RepID=A0AAD7NHS5_9AGAR|nr:hypothetical protein DFH07DRAFT_424922 [Mycena maculata]